MLSQTHRRETLCLGLQTADLDIAKRHMRLLVAWLVDKRVLSPDSGAAEAYRPTRNDLSRLKRLHTEVRRLKGVSEAEYGSEALAKAKRCGCPVGIIHYIVGRKPALSPGTINTRRMRARERARKRGGVMPMGNTWEYRRAGGKSFSWNGNVLTARLQLGSRIWHWPLKVTSPSEPEALMAPIRIARERLRQAAVEALNCELGTNEAVAAAVAVTGARAQFASAIITAGGPNELAEFVMKGPKGAVGMTSPLPLATALKATKQAQMKQCVEWLADLISANPDRPPVRLAELRKKAKSKFGIPRRLFEEGNNCCIRQAQRMAKNLNWSQGGRPRE
jgi:hypothetical protein